MMIALALPLRCYLHAPKYEMVYLSYSIIIKKTERERCLGRYQILDTCIRTRSVGTEIYSGGV